MKVLLYKSRMMDDGPHMKEVGKRVALAFAHIKKREFVTAHTHIAHAKNMLNRLPDSHPNAGQHSRIMEHLSDAAHYLKTNPHLHVGTISKHLNQAADMAG